MLDAIAEKPTATWQRDREILTWVARLGAVSLAHLRRRFGLGRTVAYRRTAALIDAGLLARHRTVIGEPPMLYATREGLRYLGLGLGVARVSPALANHWRVCADVALDLEARHGSDKVLTERELRREEQLRERPVASATLAPDASGRRQLHRPDFAIREGDRPTAIEVELTAKTPRRLERIVAGYRRARHIEQTVYLCAPRALDGVERAVRKTHSQTRVRVVRLEATTP